MQAFPFLSSYWNYLHQEHFPGTEPKPFPKPRDKYTLKLFAVADTDLSRSGLTCAYVAQSSMEDLLADLPHWDQVEETIHILHEELDNG